MTHKTNSLTNRQKIISWISVVFMLVLGVYKYNEVQIYHEAKSEGIFDTATTEIYGFDVIYHYGSEIEPKKLTEKKPYSSIVSGEQFLVLLSKEHPDFRFVDLTRPVIIDSLFDTTRYTSIDTSGDRVISFVYQVNGDIFERMQKVENTNREWTLNSVVVFNPLNPRIAYLVDINNNKTAANK